MEKRQLKSLKLSEKVEIIKVVDENVMTKEKTKQQIAKDFGIPASTLSTILKNKDEIMKRFAEGDNRKRKREIDYPDVDEAVLTFFKQARVQNISVPGPVLQGKAEFYAKKLGHVDFRASNGWMEKFKSRHDIVFKKVCGESKAVDDQVCEDWLEKLPLHCAGYKPEDIFNADESALFYKCMPDKTLCFAKEDCHGGKQSKERLTLLFAANSTGSEKLKILVIGRFKTPHCLRGKKSLPVDYCANKTAWMNTVVFCDWLEKLNQKMKKAKRKILLFIDNCSAHKDIPKLSNVTIQFLPANTTSKLQPLDQGIIRNFKCFYRKEVVCRMISDMEKKEQTRISVLDAIRMASKSWANIKSSTIANCFKKSGFQVPDVPCEDPENSFPEVNKHWEKITNHMGTENAISFDEFVDVDNRVPTDGKLTDEEIINSAKKTSSETDEDEVEDEVDDNKKPTDIISSNDAKKMLDQLKTFFENCATVSDSVFNSLINIDIAIDSEKLKRARQTTMNEFLKTK